MAVIVLYPCSQFDYLTSGRTETEAQELFEAWTAAHHPALFERDAAMPRWETASYPPFNLQQDIVIVPPCCESYWNESWEKETADCTLVRNTSRRDDIVQQILTVRNSSQNDSEDNPEHVFNDDFIADCYALATARLLIALFNRNRYYLQLPDENRLKSLMTDAIQAVRLNEPGALQQAQQSLFDEIATAKDSHHPTQNYFIELVLAAKTTVGEPLRQRLHESAQINLFMPNSVLETLPETHPDTFAQLKSATEQKKICLIADDTEPLSQVLLPILDVADHVLAGISVYRELLNVSPKIYGRLSTGLTPVLPQLLKLTDMTGAVHFAPLAGWQVKEQEQSKIVWQAPDNTSVDALVRYPIDASTYLGFFEFADQFSSQMGQDNIPTSVFALFPGQKSGWLDILRRINRFTSGLGKFVSIEEYFNNTAYSGSLQRYGYEKYPVNALMEAKKNPISQWNELYQKNTERLVQSSLETLLALLKPSQTQPQPSDCGSDLPDGGFNLPRDFVEAISGGGSESAGSGVIAVNPLSFARKMFVNDSAIDVPPMGYALVESRERETAGSRRQTAAKTSGRSGVLRSRLTTLFSKNKPAPILARKATDDIGRGEKRAVSILENQYFTAKFDERTGMLRSIFTNRSRYNQLSRQIAFRNDQTYSIQAADEIVITKATAAAGKIKITGRLVNPDGETAASFTETVTIRSQSRLLEFVLTLDPVMEMDDDRWNSYIAVRYAWNDDTLEMRGCLNDGMHVLPERKKFHSPRLIDLRHETGSLTFLSEGLPFHRRNGDRQLDTLLIVKGESQRQFRLGLAVNAKNPAFLSYDFSLGQEEFIVPVSCRPKNPSAWLFQIESNHVAALYWEPVWESDKFIGYRVYLQETEGRRAHFALRSFVPPKHASAMNFQGKELKTFKVDTDAVLIDMHMYELLPLMVRIVE